MLMFGSMFILINPMQFSVGENGDKKLNSTFLNFTGGLRMAGGIAG